MNDLQTLYSEYFDSYDPWSSTLISFFTVANELYVRGSEIPHEWEYSPGMADDPRESEDYLYDACVEADTNDLIKFGQFLHSECEKLRARGQDY